MKISVQFILSLSCLAMSGCHQDHHQVNHAFVFPTIINSSLPDTLVKATWHADCMMPSNPMYLGKYTMADVIDIAHHRDTTLMVDKMSPGHDSCNASGLELFVDYSQSVYLDWGWPDTTYAFYPVIVANRTPSLKIFRGKDSYASGLQEAPNPEFMGFWHPIEYKCPDFCGNGGWWTLLHPGEFILLLMSKYDGDEETSIRVRILNQGNVYMSEPFTGTINFGQFRFCHKDRLSANLFDQNISVLHLKCNLISILS